MLQHWVPCAILHSFCLCIALCVPSRSFKELLPRLWWVLGIGFWWAQGVDLVISVGLWKPWMIQSRQDYHGWNPFWFTQKNHIISCNKWLSWRLARTCCNDYRYIRRVSSFFISGRLHDKSINNMVLSRRIFIPTGPKKTAKAISETRMGRYHSLTVFACGYTCCYTVLLNMRGIDIQVLVFLG